jgi:hypothetical protein
MISVAIVLLALVSPVAAEPTPIRTPYAQQQPLEIRRVVLPATPVRQYVCLEMNVELEATYDNPFDSSDIAVDARVTFPGGQPRSVSGFFFRPFTRKLENGREQLTPAGEPGWRIRFTPPVAGEYSVVVTVRDRTGQRQSEPVRFAATAGDDPGFVRVSPRDRRYFEFDNHRAFFPIGLNICWPGARGTFDYDAWFPAFGHAGCNATRLWLSPGWGALALERTGKREQGLGMGQFDLGNAWRLDYVLELAQREGLYVKLCIDSFNILRQKDGYPFWDKTPHNAANGGPLAQPTDFWTSPEMDRLYRDKLRYLVARYGCFTHVLSWEFWNEVDITTGYKTEPSRDWHARMARYLRSLDPYTHLITTSCANSAGDPEVDRLPELDYVQTHLYGSADMVVTLARRQQQKAAYGKPHYVGEIGADAGGARFDDDPQGLQIHDPLWLTVATGGSGAAQPWYWERIHAGGLHPLYTAVSQFTAGIDWPAEAMRPVEPKLQWQTPPEPLPRKDLTIETTPPSWSPSEFNQPRTLQVDRTGARGQLPVAGIQHGLGGHKDKHNPVRFETDLPWPTQFLVEVGNVSGWGGAALEIRLDGRVGLKRDFVNTNPPGQHKDLPQYRGSYSIDVPAGKHTVEVENPGKDWFYSSYRLRDAVESVSPSLLAWATVGKTTALAWVRLESRTWNRICALKEALSPCAPSILVLPQLAPGRWQAELWDTWSGKVLERRALDVGPDGEAHVALPEIAKDLAVRLKRL